MQRPAVHTTYPPQDQAVLAFPLSLLMPCRICKAAPYWPGVAFLDLGLHTEHESWCVARGTRDVNLTAWIRRPRRDAA